MAERLLIVDKDRLTYEGIFDSKEVFNLVKQWAGDKGYFPLEKSHTESTKPEGRYADITLEPFKKLTDYAKSVIKLRIQFNDLKDIIVEREGKKTKLQEGKISITFDGILETDYEHHWEKKPVYYFLRIIFEKYVYTPFISGFESQIKEDLYLLKNNIKSFLNLTKYG